MSPPIFLYNIEESIDIWGKRLPGIIERFFQLDEETKETIFLSIPCEKMRPLNHAYSKSSIWGDTNGFSRDFNEGLYEEESGKDRYLVGDQRSPKHQMGSDSLS